jgi:hypothetical protein
MPGPTRSMYAVSFSGVSVSAAHDFFEVIPAANKPLILHGCIITQTSETPAEEEQLLIKVIRGHTASGSGGTTPTPVPLVSDDAAAGFSAEANNTTIASAGTPVDLVVEAFNSRMGWYWMPTPELRPTVKVNTTGVVIRLVNAPTDAITFSGCLYVEER